MTRYLKGQKVRVYSGHGWLLGSVVYSDDSRCLVFLAKEQRMVSCVDNRNLMAAKNETSK